MQQIVLVQSRQSTLTAVSSTLISLIGFVLLILAVQNFQHSSHQLNVTAQAAPTTETTPAHFVPYNINIRSFYEQQSGFGTLPIGTTSTPDSFGAYFVLPVGESLYLALGQYPARADGALVATLSTNTLSLQKIPIANTIGNRIEEQGIHLLVHDSSTNAVIFPGTDPMQSWELGNFYSIDTNSNVGTKHRNSAGLVEVVHGWGLTVSPAGNYYYGTGSYLTSVPYTTSEVAVGEVFKSSNKGLFWNRITTDPSQATSISSFLSPFRIYSLAWLNNRLYAASSNATVWHTSNEGASWEMLSGYYVDPVLTLISLNQNNGAQEFILATNQDGTNIQKINPDNSTEVFQLPFRVITGGYRHGKVTTDGDWIYVLTEDLPTLQNSVYRSKDLNTWYLVDTLPAYSAVTGGKAVALAYWPRRQEIIVATDGVEAKLYAVKVSSIPGSDFPPSSTPTPTPQNCLANPDINGSGTVDLLDISILILVFMSEGNNLPADLNCDTVVNLVDFSILISNLTL